MKAIITKYIGPTDTRGSRIKASDEDGNSITIGYDYAAESAHVVAARKLCEKMNWHGELVEGGLGDRSVFVFVDGEQTIKV